MGMESRVAADGDGQVPGRSGNAVGLGIGCTALLLAGLTGCGGGGNDGATAVSATSDDAARVELARDSLAEGAAGGPTAAQQCEALAGTMVGGAQITSATMSEASAAAPEACVVLGVLHDTLNFRVRLPTNWNGKMLSLGGGGWNGSIAAGAYSASGNREGYVVLASDGGRQGDGLDASSFLRNPQGQQDFGYLGIHSTYEVAVALTVQRYGRAPVYRYFEGCSNGGREALVQATRFPHDYDGIVVRAPAYSFTELFQQFVTIGQALKAPGGNLSDAKAALIARAAVEACDADDGLFDGIVGRPENCQFDPASLACGAGEEAGGEGDGICLTAPELATVRAIYSPLNQADSTPVYPGWGPGGEDQGWSRWVTGSALEGTGLQFQFGSGLIKYWITQDADYNVLDFDAEAWRPQLSLAATTLDAGSNLSTFFHRGGRMILVHGTHDWAISYKGSIRYFDQVARDSGGAVARDEAMEFFLQPGVQHCAGGVGPDAVDLVEPLARWVEAGERPSSQGVVARKLDAATGEATLARPLCRYPAFPRYDGSGNFADAASFSCQLN